jgi:predicted metal-dependent peptidase
LTQVLFSIPNILDENTPTASTSGRIRKFNLDFMTALSLTEQVGVVLHEVLHDALLHRYRKQHRDHIRWNIACDIVINNMIIASGGKLPPCAIIRSQWNGKSEEEVYELLADEQLPVYCCDLLDDGTPVTKDEADAMRGMLKASQSLFGNASSIIQQAIDAILVTKIAWWEKLQQFAVTRVYAKVDYSMSCRRELYRSGCCAPITGSPSLGLVYISVDQSGSISDQLLGEFETHINHILHDCSPSTVVIQYFDTVIVESVETSDYPIKLHRVAGGGTSFVEICEVADRNMADLHIVLTDLEGSFPESSLTPIVWVSNGADVAPFGTVIRYDNI